ncbi:ImmA/IrrE family metallo-endopeptidase [Carnobacterium maltaromaticum]|uniref:ImmA/IrrE family metallo-endopeptidase n=1 Tax=Carnobacterium maltaromaticum TaxID=2751 RepID=UPI0012FB9320|nr:ImmA/IrrE family metallo-endopeptidase [Carnobacterium maltaromaticum]
MDISPELEDTYTKISNLVNSFILKKEIECTDYKWFMYFNDIIIENDIDVFPHAFSRTSQGGVSGMLVKDSLGTSLSYNPLDVPFRQNFSKCHELSHFILHIDSHNENVIFKDMGTSYDEISSEVEIEANIAASIILLPDILIVKLMKTSISFPKMAETLQMTHAALYVRLVQFLEFHIYINNYYARNIINSFRYEGKKELFNLHISGFGCTVEKQIRNDYENAF